MPIRCPSCKFESADDAGWCDFCKEPFRKAKAEPEPEAAAAAQAPAKLAPQAPVELTPEVKERLAKAEKLLSVGDGEQMPAIPQWFRFLAWAFLGAWFLTGMVLAGNLLARRNAAAKDPVLDAR